jgi:hypothetical protein
VSAARSYFEGRYRDTIDGLAQASYAPGPAAVQAHVLRAAARYQLFVIGGERDAALRREVLADVEAVHRLDPAFEPDPEAFSPRFRELFRKGS